MLDFKDLKNLPKVFEASKMLGFPSEKLKKIAEKYKSKDYYHSHYISLVEEEEEDEMGHRGYVVVNDKNAEVYSGTCWMSLKSNFVDDRVYWQSVIEASDHKGIPINEESFNDILEASDEILKPLVEKLESILGRPVPDWWMGEYSLHQAGSYNLKDYIGDVEFDEDYGIENFEPRGTMMLFDYKYSNHIKDGNNTKDGLLSIGEARERLQDYNERYFPYEYSLIAELPYMKMCLVRSFGYYHYQGFWESFFWLVRHYPEMPMYLLLNAAVVRRVGEKGGYYHLPSARLLTGRFKLDSYHINNKINKRVVPHFYGSEKYDRLESCLTSRGLQTELLWLAEKQAKAMGSKTPKIDAANILFMDFYKFLEHIKALDTTFCNESLLKLFSENIEKLIEYAKNK